MRTLIALLLLALSFLPAFAGPDDLAVIVAIKRYDNAHAVEYADRDGAAMRDLAKRLLQIPDERIIYRPDSSLAPLRALFGSAGLPGEIAGRLAGRKAQRIWVYFSGHGVPGRAPRGGGFVPYLLPKDGLPGQPEHSALALDDLEAALREAVMKHARGAQMVLILDACFSGRAESGAGGQVAGRMLSPESSAGGPVRLVPRKATDDLIVLAAARDDEIASWDRDARHGLFTSLLLQAFFNGTGEGPRVTLGALDAFVAARTNERLAALFPGGGRLQRPELRGHRDVVLLDNAGQQVLDPAARVQARIQCSALEYSPDAKAIGEFLASPLCTRGCDAACRTALGERRRSLEQRADECVNLARGLEALVKARQPRVVLDAALKDLPQRCTEARGIALAAIAALAAPKVSESAPKTPMIDPKRPAAGSDAAADPALGVVPGSGKSFRDKLANGSACAFCPEMVVVPAGSFVMGSPASEAERDNDEGPQRTVTIGQAFAVGKFEVTFDEWDACVTAGGCTHHADDHGWGRGKRPVINVSWEEAKRYVAWLGKATGKHYRLLTEAEWEYAARAKSLTPYHFGASVTKKQAQFSEGSWGGAGKTVETGSFPANAWGLHDVHGNVWEWVEDCGHGNYSGAPSDGSAWIKGCTENSRVLRGGSWVGYAQFLRSAIRFWHHPDGRGNDLGFRLARTLNPIP